MSEHDAPKWQPIMMVVNRRLECQCGTLAIFVTGTLSSDSQYNTLEEVDVWCQDCFKDAQEKED